MAKKSKKRIVFYYATTPSVMVYKIAKMLKKKDYETILFTMCEKDQFDSEFYKEAFDKVICSNFQFFKPSLKNLMYVIKRFPWLVRFLLCMKSAKPYATIGISGNNWQLKLAHKYFFKKSAFIYFPYDILSHVFSSYDEALKNGVKRFEIESEKYCFENAEGIMHKGDPDELKPLDGRIFKKINFCNLQLSFLPYCSKEFSILLNDCKLSNKDKEIHIVYVGGFPNDPEFIDKMALQIKELAKQKIHIHSYTIVKHIPKEEEEKYLNELFKDIKINKYFHIKEPLDEKNIIREISQYDFGFANAFKKDQKNLNPDFGTGNKIATYLEAGLPFVYEDTLKYMDSLMKSYGLGLSFNETNIKKLGKKLNELHYKKLVKNVIKAREDLDMDKNFQRLESFIEEAANKKNE